MIPPVPVLAQQVSPPGPSAWPLALLALGIAALLWGLYRRAYEGRRRSPEAPSDRHDGGSVYVLSNSGYDRLVKIGYTTRDAATRAAELSADTGVPGDFKVEHETAAENPEAVEQAVHDRLAAHKVNKDREFFEVGPDEARRVIERVLGPEASVVRQSLGGLLCGLAVLVTFALLTYHPADNEIARSVPALEAMTPLGGGPGLPPTQNALGLFGTRLAYVLIPGGLGYLTLVPVGLVALWGYALLRSRALRPLWIPTLLALFGTVIAAASVGWAGHAPQPSPVGWAGDIPESSGVVRWAGAVGQALADGVRAELSPTGALALLVVAAGGSVALFVVWWAQQDGHR
ncbi:MAG: DNA translocase FtsK 4TM domain-containing protein [Salinibacter sp.]